MRIEGSLRVSNADTKPLQLTPQRVSKSYARESLRSIRSYCARKLVSKQCSHHCIRCTSGNSLSCRGKSAPNVTISEREWALLRSKADDLPNFVTTLYLSSYITDGGPKHLLEAGVRQGLPYFEELAHQYAGRDESAR